MSHSIQTVSAETAHRLLGEMLAAQSVIRWLKDNDLLASSDSVEDLARLYAGSLKMEREFLNQFTL